VPPSLLHPAVADSTAELRTRFRAAEPFRHIVLDRFLDETFCESLRRDFPPFDPALTMSETGVPGNKAVIEDLPHISAVYRQFDQFIQSRELLDWVGEVAGIPKLIYDPGYFGGGTHENLHDQDLDIHVDFNFHPKTHTHRRLNLIVFLNPEWDTSWGGCLELHKDPWRDPVHDYVVSIVPLFNRCVIFETTEQSWHGFRRIDLPPGQRHISRRSIAVYFYSRERPPAETAVAHNTVYVPWPIPDRLHAGYTLTDADILELKILFRRRDEQLRFLYEREKESTMLREALSNLLESRSFRLGRLLTAPIRALLGRK
jgi:hypothetical protein